MVFDKPVINLLVKGIFLLFYSWHHHLISSHFKSSLAEIFHIQTHDKYVGK